MDEPMPQEIRDRQGCDVCKDVRAPTWWFTHHPQYEVWICSTCLLNLVTWPKKKET